MIKQRKSPLTNREILKKIIEKEIDIGELPQAKQSALKAYSERLAFYEELCSQKEQLEKELILHKINTKYGTANPNIDPKTAAGNLTLLKSFIAEVDAALNGWEEAKEIKSVIKAGIDALYKQERKQAEEKRRNAGGIKKSSEITARVKDWLVGTFGYFGLVVYFVLFVLYIPFRLVFDLFKGLWTLAYKFGGLVKVGAIKSKEWLVDTTKGILGDFEVWSYILAVIIGAILSVFPLSTMDKYPLVVKIIIMFCMTAIPYESCIANPIIWVAGHLIVIQNPQDSFSAAYYVAFSVNTLYLLLRILRYLWIKRKERKEMK